MALGDIHGDLPPAAQARARDGVAHLQAAAREMIEAARAALDVAEEVVNDPEAAASVARTLATVGDLARRFGSMAGAAPGGARDPGADRAGHAEPGAEPADRAADHGRVQRITVA